MSRVSEHIDLRSCCQRVVSVLHSDVQVSSSAPNKCLQVCHMGRRVRDDLLTVARTVTDCYPPEMDVLNVYAGLYHQSFSARLTELAASGPEISDCSYLLLWVNHFYPQ